jgi:Tol biopolymer transport system component
MLMQLKAFSLLLALILLLPGCTPVETPGNLLESVVVGYVLYEERYEPQPMLIGFFEEGGLVIRHVSFSMTCPAWSPGYDRLAYSDHGTVHIRTINSSMEVVVETDFLELSAPVWSPDDDSLAFAAQNSPDLGGFDIWRLVLSSGEWQLLVQCANSTSLIDSCSSPAWLPDGRLGYVRHTGIVEGGIRSNIEVLNLDSFETDLVVEGAQIYRGWAAYGREEQMYPDHYSALAWSPDGLQVSFIAGSEYTEDRNIYVLDLLSTEVSTVLQSSLRVDTPVWLDGMHLVFRSETLPEMWEEGTHWEAYNIVVVNIDSGDIVELTEYEPILGDGQNPIISCPFVVPEDIGEQIALP